MTRLRTYAEVMARPNPTRAEEQLLEKCKAGEPTFRGTSPPDSPTNATQIRAELLRYLILGGCPAYRPDELGVRLFGAYISGTLDLSFGTAKGITELRWCRFASAIEAVDTSLARLDLSGSELPGLNAHGARVTGSVTLSEGFTATGEVNLSGAKIGGQLMCSGGRFNNSEGIALNAQGVRVTDSVFLCAEIDKDGKVVEPIQRFHAIGQVRLSGAVICGQLACDGGRFENEAGDALNAHRMRVTEGFFWREDVVAIGKVDLASAHVGDLCDVLSSWPKRGPSGEDRLRLNGFTYDRISGAATDAATRLDWLSRGDHWKGVFHPQPYEQLGKVLGEMGHAEDRRRVLMKRAELQNKAAWERVERYAALRRPLMRLGDWFQHWVIGYGYKPWYSVGWALGLIVIGWFVAWQAWHEGSFAPNSDVIVASAEWQSLARDAEVANPADVWSTKHDPLALLVAMPTRCGVKKPPPECEQGQGMDYEAFHSLAYAVDLVVPLVTLGQEATWAPSKDRGGWGHLLWWLRWVLTVFGWIVAAFAAAAVTGLIRRD